MPNNSKNSNSDDFKLSPDAIKRLGESIKKLSDKEPTISELCAEGDTIIAEEESTKYKTPRNKKSPKIPSTQAERYKLAYKTVMDKLPNWKKSIINSNKFEDRIYEEFVKEVVSLAETN